MLVALDRRSIRGATVPLQESLSGFLELKLLFMPPQLSGKDLYHCDFHNLLPHTTCSFFFIKKRKTLVREEMSLVLGS